jgi:hypothetical protein
VSVQIWDLLVIIVTAHTHCWLGIGQSDRATGSKDAHIIPSINHWHEMKDLQSGVVHAHGRGPIKAIPNCAHLDIELHHNQSEEANWQAKWRPNLHQGCMTMISGYFLWRKRPGCHGYSTLLTRMLASWLSDNYRRIVKWMSSSYVTAINGICHSALLLASNTNLVHANRQHKSAALWYMALTK